METGTSNEEFISLPGLFKASPSTDGDRRFIYFEASNEDSDLQNEVVLAKALEESSAYYLRHGNVDLSHYTILPMDRRPSNYLEYQIGIPCDVRIDGKKTFVKAELYRGESAMARNADLVWDSLTKQSPAQVWYPSIGGAVLHKSDVIDPQTRSKVTVVDKVRWNNIALDRCPVNSTVGAIDTKPIGTFCKSLGGFVMSKAITAGYGTDSAALSGGAALRKQSLSGVVQQYDKPFRNALANAVHTGLCGANPGRDDLVAYVLMFGLTLERAAQLVDQFLRDLKSQIIKEKKHVTG